MKASDLRIGNLVYDIDYYQIEVRALNLGGVFDDNGTWFDVDFCEPIPLTEEWLKRFGAEENILGIIDNMWVQFEDGEWLVCNDNDGVYDIPTIKHVNQLQNLYHALTGEELKIKNK